MRIQSTHFFSSRRFFQLSALTLLAFAGACGAPQEVGVLATRSSYLSSGPIHTLTVVALDGTYTSCLGRPGGMWSVRVGSYIGIVNNPLLTVIQGDTSCQLRITQVVMQDAMSSQTTYTSPSGLLITGNFLSAPIAFQRASAMSPDFYANVRMTPSNFTSDFFVEFIYSDDPRTPPVIDFPGGSSTVSPNMVTASTLTAPDYYIDFPNSNLTLMGSPDHLDNAFGFLFLVPSSQPAQDYVVTDVMLQFNSGAPTGDKTNLNDVAFTFQNSPFHFGAGGGPVTIEANDLLLQPGTMVPPGGLVRYVIFRAIGSGGIVSYEVLEFHFHPSF